MSEHIDREALCYQLAKQATIDGQPRAIRRAAKIVADFPAADVRPVVRGKWGHRWICSNMSGYEYACSCSECGKPTYRLSLLEKMPNFCPNCGADMREKS